MNKIQIKKLSDQAHQAISVGDLTTALNCYNSILEIDPADCDSLHFVAIVLNTQGRHKTALEMVKKAIERYSCNPAYYTTLASIYRSLGDYPEAVKAIKTACELRPHDAVKLSNAAMILADERKYDKAKEIFEMALEIDPDNPLIHFNYSLLLLTLGEYDKGWEEYEWRIPFHYRTAIPEYPKDLKGKKIQIVPDQGYGDFIMFSRYFESLKDAGAEIFVSCPKALDRLFESGYCSKPDFTIRVTSLGRLFNFIPNKTYIKAPGIKKLPEASGYKIGIASKGTKSFNNDLQVFSGPDGFQIVPHPANLAYFASYKRSLPHDFFDVFFQFNKLDFYNLQTDNRHSLMEDLGTSIKDFADLADYVDQMDVIVTIDTALAHLAGAMGKKTYLLLPYDFDWRWQADKKDSIWYPSIRILRQPVRGDWYTVQDELLSLISADAKLA